MARSVSGAGASATAELPWQMVQFFSNNAIPDSVPGGPRGEVGVSACSGCTEVGLTPASWPRARALPRTPAKTRIAAKFSRLLISGGLTLRLLPAHRQWE